MAKDKFKKCLKYDICGTLNVDDAENYFVRVYEDEDIFDDYPLNEILENIIGEQIIIKCESEAV
ncbi:MAG: hypothetical protein KBT27_04190 [Prevotellaceae bacterium]|nr:hypothetical protein [Candidatus Faecinaster equi]